jgi:hypothetical protein
MNFFRSPLTRWLLSGLLASVLAGAAVADEIADIRRVHLEALGGEARVRALQSISASGHVTVGETKLMFEMIAARPNRVRVTTQDEGRALVQGSDGVEAPWRWDRGRQRTPARMSPDEAAEFVADAEFDDPLVAGDARGYTLDFAGAAELQGQRVLRVLVTQRDVPPSLLVLDADTCLIIRKETRRPAQWGGTVTVTTVFGDYRPVAGVELPHRIEVWRDGRRVSRTDLELVQPNPGLAADAFAMPVDGAE